MLFSLRKVAIACLLVAVNAESLVRGSGPIIVADMYIITLKPSVDMERHLKQIDDLQNRARLHRHDGKRFDGVHYRYDFPGFRGYAGNFDELVINELKGNEDIDDMEADQVWTAQAVKSQQSPPTNLKLISWPGLAPIWRNVYKYHSSAGRGTFAYVIDSGIDIQHHEFEGRAVHGWSFLGNSNFDDRDGHGTYVAGIIGSKTYGVAKRCNLISVKITQGQASSASVFLAGLNWAVNDILAHNRTRKAVINVSTSGPKSTAANKAVVSAYTAGVATVATAGNENRAVARRSPGSATAAITVAATDKLKKRAPWSNSGKEVGLFAPGVDVISTWIGPSHDATRTLSGTSAAAPHVAGLAVYFQAMYEYDSKEVKAFILRLATKGLVRDAKGSPNRFAYNDNGNCNGPRCDD